MIAVAALSIAACGSNSDSSVAPTADSPGRAEAATTGSGGDPLGSAPAAAGAQFDTAYNTDLRALALAESRRGADESSQDRAVIQTGSVSLRSNDVAKALFNLQRLLDDHDGLIDDERTVTDKKGEVRMSRLVVRVPSADFDATMTGLARLGILTESTRKAKDVTTQVIDTDVRIRAQQESLERVEALLARARSIRDIVSIEAQLTRRQAELDALKATQAYLKDQTEMSTITVYLERTDKETAPPAPKKHHNPFVAGLIAGWDAFSDVAGGLAKATGASLPFLGVLALLAWPLLLLVRRFAVWSRRTTEVAAATEA